MSEVKPYDKETFTVESETLLNFIKFRRSVRRFKDMPVEKRKKFNKSLKLEDLLKLQLMLKMFLISWLQTNYHNLKN